MQELFRDDSYLKRCHATVTGISDAGITFDRSVFYALGGGQLGDTGTINTSDGRSIRTTDTVKDKVSGAHLHVIESSESSPAGTAAGQAHQESVADDLSIGDEVELILDWDRRYRIMRFHSALHMLCSLIDAPVTSGSIQVDRARLDFDLQDTVDKVALSEQLNELVARDAPCSTRWITNAELAAQPELVRTMSVQPPRNAAGTIRLVEFENIDLQPCGGTHVATTREIGPLKVQKVEKKGKQNRRIIIAFDE